MRQRVSIILGALEQNKLRYVAMHEHMNTVALPTLLSPFSVVFVAQKLEGHEPFYFRLCSSSVQARLRFFFFPTRNNCDFQKIV